MNHNYQLHFIVYRLNLGYWSPGFLLIVLEQKLWGTGFYR